MKNLVTGFILTVILLPSCSAQEIDCDTNTLDQELFEMEQKDQKIRRELMPVLGQYQEDGSGKLKLIMLSLKMERLDKKNQERLLGIFESCGWPEALNTDSHNTIYLVLQHSPDSIMRKYYPKVQAYAEKGLLKPDDPATMHDRLQMNAGLPQRYGTQTFSNNMGKNLVWPVENAEGLDSLRATVGLPSMETYFKIAKDSMKVEMYWDKTLTLEEANKMQNTDLN